MSGGPRTKSRAALQKQRDEAQAALNAIELGERTKTNQALIGRCYKFHNSCSREERWWMYFKIVAAGDWWPQAVSFQVINGTTFEVRTDRVFTGSAEYLEITHKEFSEAWRLFSLSFNALQLP